VLKRVNVAYFNPLYIWEFCWFTVTFRRLYKETDEKKRERKEYIFFYAFVNGSKSEIEWKNSPWLRERRMRRETGKVRVLASQLSPTCVTSILSRVTVTKDGVRIGNWIL
jgi:hypothetical protein